MKIIPIRNLQIPILQNNKNNPGTLKCVPGYLLNFNIKIERRNRYVILKTG